MENREPGLKNGEPVVRGIAPNDRFPVSGSPFRVFHFLRSQASMPVTESATRSLWFESHLFADRGGSPRARGSGALGTGVHEHILTAGDQLAATSAAVAQQFYRHAAGRVAGGRRRRLSSAGLTSARSCSRSSRRTATRRWRTSRFHPAPYAAAASTGSPRGARSAASWRRLSRRLGAHVLRAHGGAGGKVARRHAGATGHARARACTAPPAGAASSWRRRIWRRQPRSCPSCTPTSSRCGPISASRCNRC